MSAFKFAPYTGFRPPCDGRAQPGTKALMAYLLDRYPWAASLGIYNCRPPSIHGDGRAFDLRIPTGPGGRARPELGMQVIDLLGPHCERLGIQTLIYNRRLWSAASPAGRYYGGVHPHNDHVHGDQTPASGVNLTFATLVAVLGSIPGAAPVVLAKPAVDSGRPWPGKPSVRGGYHLGFTDDGNVAYIQRRLNAHSPPSRQIKADGDFGPITDQRVREFQRAKFGPGGVDGVVGPATWRYLG